MLVRPVVSSGLSRENFAGRFKSEKTHAPVSPAKSGSRVSKMLGAKDHHRNDSWIFTKIMRIRHHFIS